MKMARQQVVVEMKRHKKLMATFALAEFDDVSRFHTTVTQREAL